MIDRVNRYYQFPASKKLVSHFREDIGLTEQYVEIFDDLRHVIADTQTHAANVNLPLKTYNQMSGILALKCMTELIRLAEIGLEAESKTEE